VGYGTTVTWPQVATEVAANGNQGVVQALSQTPGSIGYVGISWLNQATKDGVGYAAVENKDGKYVLPTTATITSAVNAMVANTPADERVSLIDAPGTDSYPIINFEYAIISKTQPNAQTAAALRQFLTWALSPTGGSTSSNLTQVHFIALPASVVKLSQAQIAKISG
jgi:phosphate transport system substrate-binding protein